MRTSLSLLLALAAVVAVPAHAGRSCEGRPLTAAALERGLLLAQRTHDALEAGFAREAQAVVVLARAGQDLTRYGVRHSHVGLAYRETDAQGRPTWRVVHKLNHCGTADAGVFRQGLGEFFLDDLWRHEAAWSPLAPPVQARLLPLLRDNARAVALHHRPYSIVSYAWGRRYQQSNQWAIETLAAAHAEGPSDRAGAQDWLRASGYRPAVLRLGPLTRLGGRLSSANVAFDDHPDAQRFADRIETVTADSVFDWLERSGLGGRMMRLSLD